MTKIICTPYNPRDEWHLIAKVRGGTVFMEEVDERPSESDDKQDLFAYYGYKFESVCAAPETVKMDQNASRNVSDLDGSDSANKPQSKPTPTSRASSKEDGIVDTAIQFCSVFETKLGEWSLVLGAEIDCLYSSPTGKTQAYAELKTNRCITSERQKKSFIRYKLFRTWVQSYLAGVRKVIFGFRDDQGILQSIKVYDIREIPRLARPENLWDPNVGLTFASQVLAFIKENVPKERGCVGIKYSRGEIVIRQIDPERARELAGKYRDGSYVLS